jgi:hypothetical protein
MITDLSDFPRSLMLSIDILPIPTDEAVHEMQNRIMGIEGDITRWQQKQNTNNNFSAVIPYDLEQLRAESKEFLDDLSTRDQRMVFANVTLICLCHTDTKRLPRHTDAAGLFISQRRETKLCKHYTLLH